MRELGSPFSGAEWQNQRQWAQSETQEVPSEHQETLMASPDRLWKSPSLDIFKGHLDMALGSR